MGADRIAAYGGEILPTFEKNLEMACWLIVAAGVFDAVDGKVARLTKSFSDLGAQLDSLADAVGLPPSPDRDLVAEHLPEARWATLVSKPWSVAEHINVLEARALLLAVRWVVSHPAAGSVVT